MANTFSWSFEALDVELGPDAESHTDIVMTIHWRYSATDEEDPPHTATAIGTVAMTWEEGDPWIEFEDLEQSDIEGWVEEDLGEEGFEQMQAGLDAQIEEMVTPTRETKRVMPWDDS